MLRWVSPKLTVEGKVRGILCPWEILGNPCICQIGGKEGHAHGPPLSAVSRALGVALRGGRRGNKIIIWRTLQSSLCSVVFCYVSVCLLSFSLQDFWHDSAPSPIFIPHLNYMTTWKRQTGEGNKRNQYFQAPALVSEGRERWALPF